MLFGGDWDEAQTSPVRIWHGGVQWVVGFV